MEIRTITIQRLALIPLKISCTLKCFDILSDEGFCIAVKKIKVILSKRWIMILFYDLQCHISHSSANWTLTLA